MNNIEFLRIELLLQHEGKNNYSLIQVTYYK